MASARDWLITPETGSHGCRFGAGQQLHAVAVGQLHVAQYEQHVGGVLLEQFQAAGGVGGLQHGVAFELQHLGQQLAQARFVVDDEQGAGGYLGRVDLRCNYFKISAMP